MSHPDLLDGKGAFAGTIWKQAFAPTLLGLVKGPWTLVVSRAGLDRLGAGLSAVGLVPSRVLFVDSTPLTLKALSARWCEGPATVIAVGGGSVMDAAKLVRTWDLVGHPSDLREPVLLKADQPGRLICVPTTPGSGAELTATATTWDDQRKTAHALVRPDNAIYDHELLRSAPPEAIVSGAMDTMAHALEALWSRRRSSASDSLALAALTELNEAWSEPRSPKLETLQAAGALAGGAISTTLTGLAHALSYGPTAKLGIPHGLAAGLFATAICEACFDGRIAGFSAHELWQTSGAGGFVADRLGARSLGTQELAALDPQRAPLSDIAFDQALIARVCLQAMELLAVPGSVRPHGADRPHCS